MRLKSYFSSSVEAAMSLARRELGLEAMLVRSREAPPEARHLGIYEVVFAAPAEEHANTPAPLRKELTNLFQVGTGIEAGKSRNVLALVGPPGSGKTTTLVKLALRFGVAARIPVRFISLDTHRVAGAEPLCSYASLLGAGFEQAGNRNELRRALSRKRPKASQPAGELVLIDTPGWDEHQIQLVADLAEFLSKAKDVEIHLVLPASMKPADLWRAADRYAVFGPSRLLFTRLDETCQAAGIVSEAIRIGKPVSFLSRGRRITEDIEPATREFLLDGLLGEDRSARTAA